MKRRWMHLIAGFTMSVLCISVCITTVNADVVWEDNFDDGILDGWTILGYENSTSPVEIEGNISAASGMLKVLDDDMNIARHNSTTNVGTWSFDLFVPDDGYGSINVEFMSNGSTCSALGNASFVAVRAWLEEDKFVVWRMVGSGSVILESIYVDSLQGWHHIDVCRSSDGRSRFYFNGTLEADFTQNVVSSSTYLQFLCHNATGAAIDNLVVDDIPKEPPTTTTTPTTTTNGGTTPPPINPVLIGVLGGIGVGVVLIAIIVLRRR